MECWDRGVWNVYELQRDGQRVTGFVKASDETAFLQRNPDAQLIGVQPCPCVEAKQRVEMASFVGLPKHREHCTFEWFDELSADLKEGKTAARHYAEQMANGKLLIDDEGRERIGLLLQGSTGVGKSSLAACVVRARIEAGMICRWIDANEFLSEVYKAQQRSFDRNPDPWEADLPDNPFEFVDAIARTPFLVFDDLGDMERRKPVTDYQRDQIYAVIRYRYENELPTIITTNLDSNHLYDQLGRRIVDRIGETFVWCPIDGYNLRFGN